MSESLEYAIDSYLDGFNSEMKKYTIKEMYEKVKTWTDPEAAKKYLDTLNNTA